MIAVCLAGASWPAARAIDNPFTVFADPGKYEYYHCEQIAGQRKHWSTPRAGAAEQLMDKAEQERRRRGRQRAGLQGRSRRRAAKSSRCSRRLRAPRNAIGRRAGAAIPPSGDEDPRLRCTGNGAAFHAWAKSRNRRSNAAAIRQRVCPPYGRSAPARRPCRARRAWPARCPTASAPCRNWCRR